MGKRVVALALGLAVVAHVRAFGAEDAFRFIVTGDTRGATNGVNLTILAEQRDACIAEGAELVLVPGDLVSTGQQSQLEFWVQTFMAPLQAAGIQVLPCRGNHDFINSATAWATVFSGPQALPDNGPPGEKSWTYSVHYKTALFVAMDHYAAAPPLQVNQTWLDAQFASSMTPHVFVFGHTPAFKVEHADCLDDAPALRDAFWDSLGAAGAQVYFCGHDHFLHHAQMMDSKGRWIHQYVCGGGGAPLRTWSGVFAETGIEWTDYVSNYGYLVVDVDGPSVTLQLKQRAGAGEYVELGEPFTYVAAHRVPAVAGAGLALAMGLIALAYGLDALRQTSHLAADTLRAVART